MGLSKLGQHDLNDNQFDMLVARYKNPQKTDQVLWTNFMKDIESGKNIPLLVNIILYTLQTGLKNAEPCFVWLCCDIIRQVSS